MTLIYLGSLKIYNTIGYMLAYKTLINIQDDTLNIHIPSKFVGKRVELIILETEEEFLSKIDNVSFNDANEEYPENIKTLPNEFQKFLLTAPTCSENEYNYFKDARKLFDKWKKRIFI